MIESERNFTLSHQLKWILKNTDWFFCVFLIYMTHFVSQKHSMTTKILRNFALAIREISLVLVLKERTIK